VTDGQSSFIIAIDRLTTAVDALLLRGFMGSRALGAELDELKEANRAARELADALRDTPPRETP
jgi:RecA/RadA recombinase